MTNTAIYCAINILRGRIYLADNNYLKTSFPGRRKCSPGLGAASDT